MLTGKKAFELPALHFGHSGHRIRLSEDVHETDQAHIALAKGWITFVDSFGARAADAPLQ